MDPAMERSQVEMKVLGRDTPQNAQAQIDPDTSAPSPTGQESNDLSPQNGGPSHLPDPATDSLFPRIFKQPPLEDVLRDVLDGCSTQEAAEAWSKTAEIVKTYSDDMVRKWNSEIDTLLVYAGLFSAILTAFNVESYKLLQPSAPDPTVAILERMSAQLRSFSVTTPFINSTEAHYTLATAGPESPTPTRAAVWLNTLWFSALICSLSSASIGLMVKQWLRELTTGLSGTSQQVAQIRQYRLNNLEKWRVAGIVSMLPLLLQLSLVLFLSGLLVLLWTLHAAVAAVSSALVGLLLAFMVATIVLPTIKVDCCYISPWTHALLPLVVQSRRFILIIARLVLDSVCGLCDGRTYAPLTSWLYRALQSVTMMLDMPESSTWSIREVLAVGPPKARDLAVDQVLRAYSLTFQSGYLNEWGRVCLMDSSFRNVGFLTKFIDGIDAIDRRQQDLGFSRTGDLEDLEVWLYVLLRLCVPDGRNYDGDSKFAYPFPPRELYESNIIRAKSYISRSMIWGRLERCRPDALDRILKTLASITPIIIQDDMDDNSQNITDLVVLLSERRERLNSWSRARYVAQITEELLRCPDPSPSSTPLDGPHRSVDLMNVLVTCAELENAPTAIANRMRLLAWHEGTRVVHNLHNDTGRAILQDMSALANVRLVDLLRKLQWIEGRCRKIDEAHDAPWIRTSNGQPVPSLISPRSCFDSTDGDGSAPAKEVLKLCEDCIPSFLDPALCPICCNERSMPEPSRGRLSGLAAMSPRG